MQKTTAKTPVMMSWSGGKDSAVALHELMRAGQYQVVGLMTSVAEEFHRISHHGVREELLELQAKAIGLPLMKIYLPSGKLGPCTNDVYERIMSRAMDELREREIFTVAFGDLFLEDLRVWRENNLAKVGMRGVFPVWKRPTPQFARELIAMGFKAHLSCVEAKVGRAFVGRAYDTRLLADLPPGIDPCGEYGEFHTYVHDGPCFQHPVPIRVGEIVERDTRFYADLLPAADPTPAPAAAAQIPPV